MRYRPNLIYDTDTSLAPTFKHGGYLRFEIVSWINLVSKERDETDRRFNIVDVLNVSSFSGGFFVNDRFK